MIEFGDNQVCQHVVAWDRARLDFATDRTKEALRFKKQQGIKLGRPKGPGKSKLDAFRPEIESLLANGTTQKFIANRYRTTEANLHNWLKKHGLKTARASQRV